MHETMMLEEIRIISRRLDFLCKFVMQWIMTGAVVAGCAFADHKPSGTFEHDYAWIIIVAIYIFINRQTHKEYDRISGIVGTP